MGFLSFCVQQWTPPPPPPLPEWPQKQFKPRFTQHVWVWGSPPQRCLLAADHAAPGHQPSLQTDVKAAVLSSPPHELLFWWSLPGLYRQAFFIIPHHQKVALIALFNDPSAGSFIWHWNIVAVFRWDSWGQECLRQQLCSSSNLSHSVLLLDCWLLGPNSVFFKNKQANVYLFILLCGRKCGHMDYSIHVVGEQSTEQSSHRVGPGDQTKVIRLGCKPPLVHIPSANCQYLLSILIFTLIASHRTRWVDGMRKN